MPGQQSIDPCISTNIQRHIWHNPSPGHEQVKKCS